MISDLLSTCPQSCLVAVVVPDPEVLPAQAKGLGCSGSMEELCKNLVMFWISEADQQSGCSSHAALVLGRR